MTCRLGLIAYGDNNGGITLNGDFVALLEGLLDLAGVASCEMSPGRRMASRRICARIFCGVVWVVYSADLTRRRLHSTKVIFIQLGEQPANKSAVSQHGYPILSNTTRSVRPSP